MHVDLKVEIYIYIVTWQMKAITPNFSAAYKFYWLYTNWMSVRLAILLNTKISSKVKIINVRYITVAISANLYFTLAICTCKNTNIINLSVSMHIY